MYQPEQRIIHLRATQPNHQWAMEMIESGQIHHRDRKLWVVIRETLDQGGLHITIQEVIFAKTQEKTEAKTMTTEIEKTKRAMYADLKRFEAMVGSTHLFKTFQDSLEAHLEELRKAMVLINESTVACAHHSAESFLDLETRLSAMTEERDQIQGRLHAIDNAYCEQSNMVSRMASEIDNLKVANQAAGEELRKAKEQSRIDRQDLISAEQCSDDFSEKLTHATTVIGQQEQLIVGQRSAIASMHTELTHSRVIRKAFQRAQGAFSVMDAALHESAPYSAQKALGDDIVDVEWQP